MLNVELSLNLENAHHALTYVPLVIVILTVVVSPDQKLAK
jgi:hypothetical protein